MKRYALSKLCGGVLLHNKRHFSGVLFTVLHVCISKGIMFRSAHLVNEVINSIEKNDSTNEQVRTCVFFFLLNALPFTIGFNYRRYYLNMIKKYAELDLFNKRMREGYEKLHEEAPFGTIQRITRHSHAICYVIDGLLFDVIPNILSMAIAIRKLMELMEQHIVVGALFFLGVAFMMEILLYNITYKYKKELVRNKVQHFAELEDAHENFVLMKMAGEKDFERICATYNYSLFLMNGIFENTITPFIAIFLLVPHSYVLSKSHMIRSNIVSYFVAFGMLAFSATGLIRSVFLMESNRLKIDISENEEEVWMTPKSDLSLRSEIRMDNVSIFSRDSVVLKNINFILRCGDVIALVGPNGAGKSMFLKFLLGFLKHTGDVHADGHRFLPTKNDMKKMIGYSPQNPHAFAGTVYDNLSNDKDTLEETWSVAKEYGVDGYFGETKDGLMQRMNSSMSLEKLQAINILRAINRKGTVLLLDEPLSHIGNEQAARIMDSILANKERRLVCVVMHRHKELHRFNKILCFGNKTAVLYESYEEYAKHCAIVN